MVTHRIKHFTPDETSSTQRVVASRVKGLASGKVKPVRSYYELAYSYSVNPKNGNSGTQIASRFPSGTYDALSTNPEYEHHRFLGWYTQENNASNEYATVSGDQKISSDNVDYHLPAIYGNWQAATSVMLVSQMPDWDPEMDHDCYVGQQYGELPEYAGGIYDAEIEYLQGNNSTAPYIDTGYIPTLNTRIECDHETVGDNSYYEQYVFGIRAVESQVMAIWYKSGNSSIMHVSGRFGSSGWRDNFQLSKRRNTIIVDRNGQRTSEGTTIFSWNVNSYSTNYSLWLFNGNDRGSGYAFNGKIYSCKIYENDQLVMDFIPVRKGSVGYMYDKVSKQLFGNQGSGNFILGNDIVPIEYLESTGTQWIDTGIVPTTTTGAMVKCATISTSTGDGCILMIGSDSWRWGFSYNSKTKIQVPYYLFSNTGDWDAPHDGSSANIQVFSPTVPVVIDYNYTSPLNCLVDGVKVRSLVAGSTTTSGTAYLFTSNYNGNGSTWRNGKLRCYSCKIKKDDVVVFDAIPVRVGQTGYMYDRISNRLIANSGSGNFGLGNDISDSSPYYRFLGWYTQQRTPDKTANTSGNHVVSTSTVTYRPTLYALWQLPSDIAFDATTNGGSMQPWSHNYYMTLPYGELPDVDDRPHYYYEGWFTQATGGTKITTASIVPGNTTLYAQWSAAVNIIFDATTNGGQMPPDWVSPDYFAGHTYETLPVPTHPKLNFSGWYLNGEPVDEDSVVPAGGATLVAQYVAQTYTVDISNGDWVLQSPNTNPDPTAYNGVYQSDRYHGSPPGSGCVVKMYINTVGYQTFDIYIRSNGENGWSYAIAVQPDIDPSSYSDAMSNALADTDGKATGTTTIDGYTKVTYDLGGGSHRICIAYIHKDSYVVGDDRGYVLIPKPAPSDDDAIYLPDLDDALYDEAHENAITLEEEE